MRIRTRVALFAAFELQSCQMLTGLEGWSDSPIMGQVSGTNLRTLTGGDPKPLHRNWRSLKPTLHP